MHISQRFLVAMAVLSTAATAAVAQDTDAEFKRPKYKFLRHAEDWSVMADKPESAPSDYWDGIKYVPLSDDGEAWASFGGHMRFRFEEWNNFGFNDVPANDDSFGLWRLLVHGDFHFGKNLRAFIEGKSALSTDRELPGGKRTLDIDSLALQQAFVDVKFDLGDSASLTLRPGRQELLFGKQRLVSPLPWGNTLRTWDGVSAVLSVGDWKVTPFWTQFAPVQKYEFNSADAGNEFFGVYAVGKAPGTDIGLDLYWLVLDRDAAAAAAFNGTAGEEKRHTIGGRLSGKFGKGFDYDVEGAYQFGDVGAGDVDAFFFASQLGYGFADAWGAPRVHLGFDYASGDKSAGGDVETFNQLFPLGHAYLGYIDIVGRQNIVDVNPGVTFKPGPKTTIGLNAHFFWRAEDTDALYNAGGGVVRGGASGTSDDVGTELDLTVVHNVNAHTKALFGYSRFIAGDFITESGPDNNIDFYYFQVQYTF